jgi:hypothetical protein
MSETNEQETKEMQPRQDSLSDSAYETIYRKLASDLRDIIDQESRSSLLFKHKIGTRIYKTRREMEKAHLVTSEKGWNGELGKLTKRLTEELDYERQTLNYCYRFFETYPSWVEFAEAEFEVLRGDANRLESPAAPVKVLGKDLFWKEVIALLPVDQSRKGSKKAKPAEQAESKDNPPQPMSIHKVSVPITEEAYRRLDFIARKEGMSPEEMAAKLIEGYAMSYVI